MLIFAGRRWRVTAVDQVSRVVELLPATGGRPPKARTGGRDVHDVVRARMRTVLASTDLRAYLDAESKQLLGDARRAFAREHLDRVGVLDRGPATLLLPWAGTATTETLVMQLQHAGVPAADDGLVISCSDTNVSRVVEVLEELAANGPCDPIKLASCVKTKRVNKYDVWLSESLLDEDYAARRFRPHAAHAAVLRLLDALPSS